jgi:hypothetical protein
MRTPGVLALALALASRLGVAAAEVNVGLLFQSDAAVAQGTNQPDESSIGGVVLGTTGAPLAGAAVEVPALRVATTTDADGRFTLRLPSGTHTLRIWRLDHVVVERTVQGGTGPLQIQLQLRDLQVEKVTVNAQRIAPPAKEEPGRYVLSSNDVQQQIGSFEDIMRSVQSLPGVSRASDYHGEYFLRGAGSSANAVYLDGIPIFFPYHILGFNSIFNPGLVESAEFYAGGAPAAYAGGAGGLMLIRSRSEDRSPYRGKVGLSYLSGHLRTGGRGARHGWALSLRRSYHDQVVRLVNGSSSGQIPSFYDAMLRAKWKPADGHLLEGGVLLAGDGLSMRNPEGDALRNDFIRVDSSDDSQSTKSNDSFDSSQDQLALHNRMRVGSLYWRAVMGSNAFLETRLGYAPQRLRFSLHGENDASLDIETQLASLRSDLTWLTRGHRLQLGFEGYRTRTTGLVSAYASFLNLRRTNSALNLNDQPERYLIDVASTRTYGALYLQDDWPVWGGRLELTRGLRYEHDGLTREHLISPRLGFRTRARGGWSLRGTWGVYNTLRNTPMEVQPTRDGTPLQAERVVETTFGVSRAGDHGWKAGVTGYHKSFSNLVYESEPAYYSNGAQARSHGLETWLAWTPHSSPLSARVQYAWSKTQQRDAKAWRRRLYEDPVSGEEVWGAVFEQPYWYSPLQDQRHHFGFDARLELRSWEFGAHLELASGLPYTPVESVVEDSQGKPFGIVGRKGSARLPLYRRLDLRVMRFFRGGSLDWRVYAEVLNATAAHNVYMYRSSRDYSQRYSVTMLPFLPTLGVEASF